MVSKKKTPRFGWPALLVCLAALPAAAQQSSILVQCPPTTLLHPSGAGIKCDHLVAGDGFVTMAGRADPSTSSASPGSRATSTVGQDPAPNSPGYPGWVMEQGTLAANAPAPTIAVDEDDEFFLTLTNVGMVMRPDLFDPHSVHWHGFPNAASVFDGVPDSSIVINMAATLTYYYNAKDAGTYMFHCHVEAAEHMQMGMLGNLYVRPRQNQLTLGTSLFTAFATNGATSTTAGRRRRRRSTPAPRIWPVPSTPSTTATGRRATTWSTRSRSAPSTPTSTTPAGTSSRSPSPA